MSGSDIPIVSVLAISSVMLALSLPGAARAWRTYAGVSERRQEDAEGRAPPPDREVAERIAALEALGYRRIGETWTSTPGGSGFAYVLTSTDEAVYVLLGPAMGRPEGLTGFYSSWRDGQWLGTLRDFGDPYETAGLRLRIERGSLAAAEGSHRAEVAAMSGRHGELRRIMELADVLVLDADYRTRFGGRELRPQLIRTLLPVTMLACLVVFLALALIWLP